MLRHFFNTMLTTAVLLAFAASAFADKSELNGSWILDKAKSEGLPKDMDQKMKVKIEGDTLELETDLFQGDNITTVNDSYLVTGKETEYPARLQNGLSATGKRTAKWSADGKGLEVQEAATFETPEGSVKITMQRKWRLSDDGKTLQIELHHTGPNGPITSKRTFTKK